MVLALSEHASDDLVIEHAASYEQAFAPLFSKQWGLVLVGLSTVNEGSMESLKKILSLLDVDQTPTIVYDDRLDQLELAQSLLTKIRENVYFRTGSELAFLPEELISSALKPLSPLC